jgi:hypothetical protein
VDRPFDNEKSEQENTDLALTKFIDGMSESLIIPALHLVSNETDGEKAKTEHVFVNLGLMPFVVILDVVVYSPPEQTK